MLIKRCFLRDFSKVLAVDSQRVLNNDNSTFINKDLIWIQYNIYRVHSAVKPAVSLWN